MSDSQLYGQSNQCVSSYQFNQCELKQEELDMPFIVIRNQFTRQQSRKANQNQPKALNKKIETKITINDQQQPAKTKNYRLPLDEKKAYWLGFMDLIMENPFIMYTWQQWRSQCYEKIEKYIKRYVKDPKVDRIKIKSFDQNMKKKYYIKQKIDIQEAIIHALKNYQLNENEQRTFQKYNLFLQARHTLFKQAILSTDKCIQQNKQQFENIKHIQNQCHRLFKKNELYNESNFN